MWARPDLQPFRRSKCLLWAIWLLLRRCWLALRRQALQPVLDTTGARSQPLLILGLSARCRRYLRWPNSYLVIEHFIHKLSRHTHSMGDLGRYNADTVGKCQGICLSLDPGMGKPWGRPLNPSQFRFNPALQSLADSHAAHIKAVLSSGGRHSV